MFLVDESYRILGQPSIEDFSAEEKVMELVEIFRKVVFHGIPDFVPLPMTIKWFWKMCIPQTNIKKNKIPSDNKEDHQYDWLRPTKAYMNCRSVGTAVAKSDCWQQHVLYPNVTHF